MICWLDLETTGLDPRAPGAKILEIALVFAPNDAPDQPMLKWDHVLPLTQAELDFLQERPEAQWALAQHKKSGLLDECLHYGTFGGCDRPVMDQVEGLLKSFLAQGEKQHTLGGNSVHFDKGWLNVHAPAVAGLLGYRLLDMSAVQIFMSSLGAPKRAKVEGHRALQDLVEDSIPMYQHYAAFVKQLQNPAPRGEELAKVLQPHLSQSMDVLQAKYAADGSMSKVEAEAFDTLRLGLHNVRH